VIEPSFLVHIVAMDLLRAVIWLALALGLGILPFGAYLLVVSLAALSARRTRHGHRESGPSFLIAIPAHDEESGIGRTVQSCKSVDYPASLFEVLVIADNCQDRTAACARSAGASVLERFHETDRSKGHALKYLFDQLAESGKLDALDAVVVIDADTVVDPALLRGYADHLEHGHDWVQAFDTVANWNDSWRTRLMTLSFTLVNGVLLLGQTALGLSAGFRGNGMCFSTKGLCRRPWSTFGLVEDLEYSWSLRIAGERIAFASGVSVFATMLAEGGAAAAHQRRRWEHGRSQLKWTMLGPLLRSPALGPIEKMAALIELRMPGLVVLASAVVGSMLFCLWLLVTKRGSAADPPVAALLMVNALSSGALALYVFSAFVVFSLDWRLLLSLTRLPLYAVWKLGTVLRRRPTRWIRTARTSRGDGGPNDPSSLPSGSQDGMEPDDKPCQIVPGR
jgi:cellulose synthase/poly-beta-1,6-N-acetylglucosamine synthase-like glycosyltransferase